MTSKPSYRYGAQSAARREYEEEEEVESVVETDDLQSEPAADHGPVTEFKDLTNNGLVCKTLVDTLVQDMGMKTMTPVQSLTIHESLKGGDMYVGSFFPLGMLPLTLER